MIFEKFIAACVFALIIAIVDIIAYLICQQVKARRQVIVFNVTANDIRFELFRRTKAGEFLPIDFGCISNEETKMSDAVDEYGEIYNSLNLANKIRTMIDTTKRIHKKLSERSYNYNISMPAALILHTSEGEIAGISKDQKRLAEDAIYRLGYSPKFIGDFGNTDVDDTDPADVSRMFG